MSASVFAFPSRGKGPQPWTNDELAELYRVVDLLGRAGLAVTTDMGMSDEGDPWFVFCRIDNDEVIAHFARIDGIFVAASIAVDETFRGANFRQIVDRMVSSQPLVMPRPHPGSKLFVHPAVMLTAFVATALAHSDKMIAQDWLRSVEARWEHGKASALAEIKQVKTAWADTLHSLFKLPIDSRIGHEAGKEDLSLTLASMIAIAMTALQPIVDKIAQLSHLVADEMSAHTAAGGSSTAGHAWQIGQDESLPVFADDAGTGGEHGSGGSGHGGSDAPQLRKALLAADVADSQKALADTVHTAAIAVAAVQKPDADAAPVHAQISVQTIDTQSADLNGAFLLIQQKAIAMQQPPPTETFALHIDSGLLAQSIGVQDVTAEAIQLLSINSRAASPGTDADSGKPAPSGDIGAAADPAKPAPSVAIAATGAVADPAATGAVADPATSAPSGQTASSETPSPSVPADPSPAAPATPSPSSHDVSVSTPATPATPTVVAAVTSTPTQADTPPAVTSYPTGNQIIDVASSTGVAVIQAISDFANNSAHLVDPQKIAITASLSQELQTYFDGNSSLKLVFFESTNAVPDVFQFSSGVVFVAEKDVSPLAHLVNGGGTLTLDEPGGTVTLVGLATIEPSAV